MKSSTFQHATHNPITFNASQAKFDSQACGQAVDNLVKLLERQRLPTLLANLVATHCFAAILMETRWNLSEFSNQMGMSAYSTLSSHSKMLCRMSAPKIRRTLYGKFVF
jgi:hypothetical protein